MILIAFPAAFSLVLRAQLNRLLKSSDTLAAVEESAPEIVPGLGAASGIVKTRGSGGEGAEAEGLEGGMLDFLGKRI